MNNQLDQKQKQSETRANDSETRRSEPSKANYQAEDILRFVTKRLQIDADY